MSSQAGPSSNALVRKRAETDLMAPPPPSKKIKRPKQVLDEDSYTDALSHIIARDFFPGLLEIEIKNEYLDAQNSGDAAWIASAGRRLEHVMAPGSRKGPSALREFRERGGTPATNVGATPASEAPSALGQPSSRPDVSLSLSNFQAKYTSEDNESFYKLVDKQNQKRADKYAWLWRGNQMPSKRMIKQKEVEYKLQETRSLVDDGFKRDRLAIRDVADKPAQPDTWKFKPRNDLMFEPDGVDEGSAIVAKRADEASKMGPKTIVYENTRIPEPHVPQRPPSPTMSSVRDAIAGRPRQQDQASTAISGGESPRIGGYGFVGDDEAEPITPQRSFDLGPGDTVNPFKIQEQRDRETLHERMVQRIAKSKQESSTKGFTGTAERTPAPKFPSSPRVHGGDLTPAAQRLWSKIGSPARRADASPFGQTTPARPRSSLLRSVVRQTPKSTK
jgi:protein DGCR14